jgi:sensor histidine kinase regulating citrate/malate metabolism
MIFLLYDGILLKVEKEKEREMLLQQNVYYENQFNLMKASEETMRGLRHDFMNHMAVLGSLLEERDYAGTKDYIGQISHAGVRAYRHVDTGNMDFDCILNLKLQDAANRGVAFTSKVIVPDTTDMDTFDLTTILGNLLDNAIEAASACEKESVLDIYIKYTKGRLIIRIINTCEHEVDVDNRLPSTTKEDKANHGIGLKHVAQTLKKYNGSLNLSISDGMFKAVAMAFKEQA